MQTPVASTETRGGMYGYMVLRDTLSDHSGTPAF
jgi:hypothetical protein